MERADAESLDRVDPLRDMRAMFSVPEGPIYMDGNSLGPPPKAVEEAIGRAVAEWREHLVQGWESWIDLPVTVGDSLGRLLGAGPGQVAVCDSTTVNLYKVALAALGAQPGSGAIVGLAGDFPTDRYVLQGLSASTGRPLRLVGGGGDGDVEDELLEAIDAGPALVCLSHVDYRSGRRLDAGALTARAHEAGALVIWDLAHSAGAVPVELDSWGADLAVGCTYKYVNAGPGAPGFLYVRRELQGRLRQPIWGWFGQSDQFAMGARYDPAPGIASFLTGTPGVVGLRAVEAAVAVIEQAGVAALWAKSELFTACLHEQAQARLEPLGARIVTPSDPRRRGAHISIAHPQAWPWCRALIDAGRVIGDFRPPDVIRLGPAAAYTRFVDCYDAVEAMAETLRAGVGEAPPPRRVT